MQAPLLAGVLRSGALCAIAPAAGHGATVIALQRSTAKLAGRRHEFTCIYNICSYNLAMTVAASQPRGCSNFKLRQLLRGVSRHYDAELAKAGLKGTQYSMLAHIAEFGPIAPGDLARRLSMDASTLTRNMRVLIAQGWATQGPGHDTRSRSIELTAEGRAKRAAAKAHWKRAQLAFNERLGQDAVVALHTLLDHALAHFATTDDD